MNGNISKDGIRKDLLWMKRIGISGIHVFDAGLSTPKIVPHRITYMTEAWQDCFRYALRLADSLGLKVTIPSSPGWSNTGGPWVKPEDGMKKLTWRWARVRGGKKVAVRLPEPFVTTGSFQNVANAAISQHTLYRDIAVVAVRNAAGFSDLSDLHPVISSSSGTLNGAMLCDGDLAQSVRILPDKDGKIWVEMDFGKPLVMKSLTLSDGTARSTWHSAGAPLTWHLETSDDGLVWKKACDIPQSGARQQTISLPSVTARRFRAVCNKPQTDRQGRPFVTLSELNLRTKSRVNFAEEKAGFTMFGDLWQHPTPQDADAIAPDAVRVLARWPAEMDRIVCQLPPGDWTIYRFGWSLIGKSNGPASPEATGLEVDKMDTSAVNRYINHYLSLYEEASKGIAKGHGVSALLVDSYEAGSQTWTPKMADEFAKRRGYDLARWLPALAGEVIGSASDTEGFLYDWRKTIGELFEEGLYEQVSKAAKARGLTTYMESNENGRQLLADGMAAKSKADVPMAAMWADKTANKKMYQADIKEASSVANLYGRRCVAGESFTADGRHEVAYTFYPGNLKPVADLEMAMGLNQFVIHESAHQPLDSVRPGLALAIYGQWFNRHETWAEQAKGWIDYLGRSSFMLRQGRNVADIALYYGEDNSVTGLYGSQMPAIPAQYAFDFVNTHGLDRALWYDGKALRSAGGACYRLLVLGKNCRKMTLPALRKINALARAGANIYGQQPETNPSLGEDKAEWRALVDDTWGQNRRNVMAEGALKDALERFGISPDFVADEADSLRYMHRVAGQTHVYWVSNSRNRWANVAVKLGVTGLKPELWRPETGAVERLSYRMEGTGGTTVWLSLKPHDAVFVVLRTPAHIEKDTVPVPQQVPVMILDGPWEVQFDPRMGAPKQQIFPQLMSYTESDNPAIKYYSGTAVYRKTFDLPMKKAKHARYMLDLGAVKSMAEVWLNGKKLGVLWQMPYETDVTQALKRRENRLEIRVINLWPNRIIGDKQPRTAKTYTWCSYNGAFKAGSALLPSGLLGPVMLKAFRNR